MKFYLLARLSDDTLVLISDTGFADRASALDALGRVAAEPDFALRDAELLIFDIDQATPVLMVQPTTPIVELESFADEEIEAVLGDTAPADEDMIDELISAVADDLDEEELAEESLAEKGADVIAFEAPEPAAADEETQLLAEELVIEEAIAAQIVSDAMDSVDEDADVAPIADEVPAEPAFVETPSELTAVDAPVEQSPSDDLRAALTRTTSSMAAAGIVAPESVPSRNEWPWKTGDEASVAEEPAPPAPSEPTDELEPGSDASASFTEEAVVELADEPAAESEIPAPVAEAPVEVDDLPDVMPQMPHAFDPLEEPAIDATPLVHAAPVADEPEGLESEPVADAPAIDEADAAEPEAAVPADESEDLSDFILGLGAPENPDAPTEEPAYATEVIAESGEGFETQEPQFAPEAPSAPEAFVAEEPPVAPEAPAAIEPVTVPELPVVPDLPSAPKLDDVVVISEPEVPAAPVAVSDSLGAPASDFEVPAPPVAPSAPVEDDATPPSAESEESSEFGSDLTTLTCDDCVYVATCPNKEQSDPSTCGSFQWKTL